MQNRIRLTVLPLILALASCQPAPPPDDPMPGSEDAGQVLHSLDIERAYTLEDARDLDFRARIAAEAATICGMSGHVIQSTEPYGPERFGDDFIYRMVRVGITCNP